MTATPADANSDPEVPPGTLDLIYEHIKDAPDQQSSDWRDLDSKAVQVLAVASVVMGLAGVSSSQHRALPATILLFMALAAYVAAAVFAARGVWPRAYEPARFAATLWEDFWQYPPDEVKHGLVEGIAEAYQRNDVALNRKVAAVKVAMLATAAEVVLVVAATLADRLAG
jgi:phage shock protein PspC (stress-responsive transcriptional regulator)